MKTRCKENILKPETKNPNRAGQKNMVAANLQGMGIIEQGGIHEVTDDGVYKIWTTPGRINRMKVACFLDTEVGFMVKLPQDCSDYCPECDRNHGGLVAIPS